MRVVLGLILSKLDLENGRPHEPIQAWHSSVSIKRKKKKEPYFAGLLRDVSFRVLSHVALV